MPVEEIVDLGITIVQVRKGRREILRQRVLEGLGLPLPSGARCIDSGPIMVVGIGVGTWLAIREHGGYAFTPGLRDVVADCASVTEHSDGYVVLRLAGPAARGTLARMLPIDLHPRVFKAGDVAVTMAHETGVIVWQLPGQQPDAEAFHIAIHRSFAADFADRLSAGLTQPVCPHTTRP